MDKNRPGAVAYLSVHDVDQLWSTLQRKRRYDQMITYLDRLNTERKEVYIDDGFTGSPDQRPQLKEMMGRLKNKEFDTLIVSDIFELGDHFSDSIGCIKALVQNGVRVICIDNHVDTNCLVESGCVI